MNKKLVAFATSAAMLASVSIGFMTTTSAYDPKAEDNAVLALRYDAVKSDATTKYIDVYCGYSDEDGIAGAKLVFNLSSTEATNASFVAASSDIADIQGPQKVATALAAGQITYTVDAGDLSPHTLENNYLGYLQLTIPATLTDLEVDLDDSSCLQEGWDLNMVYYSDGAKLSPVKAYEETSDPTEPPTQAPTATPTAAPTATPTAAPTATPTAAPTATPTAAPTATPTAAPTLAPVADHDDGFAFAAKIDEIKNAAQLMLTVKATKGGVTKEGSKNIKGDIPTISGIGDLKLGVIIANIPGDVTIDSVSIKPIY